MAIALDQIVPWGRSREEYELMFSLGADEYAGGVLDCAGGPASFTAEAAAHGIRVVSVDPIYIFSGADIRDRFERVVESLISQVRATPQDWIWKYHRGPDDLRASRRASLERFLADYELASDDQRPPTTRHRPRKTRYVAGELPSLPFHSGSFGLALSSHLLFLYSDFLGKEFHIRAVAELCRVAAEVRIFPLLNLSGKLSPHLAAVQSALRESGWTSESVAVDYELQRGGNQMLRIFRPAGAAAHG